MILKQLISKVLYSISLSKECDKSHCLCCCLLVALQLTESYCLVGEAYLCLHLHYKHKHTLHNDCLPDPVAAFQFLFCILHWCHSLISVYLLIITDYIHQAYKTVISGINDNICHIWTLSVWVALPPRALKGLMIFCTRTNHRLSNSTYENVLWFKSLVVGQCCRSIRQSSRLVC